MKKTTKLEPQFFFFFAMLIFLNNQLNALNPTPNHNNIEYEFELPTHTYHKYCKNIYSQNGEDGILQQLIKELNIKNGTFCEFGASDGITSSNTYNLIKNFNFSGLAIEYSKQRYEPVYLTIKPSQKFKYFRVQFFIRIKTTILMFG